MPSSKQERASIEAGQVADILNSAMRSPDFKPRFAKLSAQSPAAAFENLLGQTSLGALQQVEQRYKTLDKLFTAQKVQMTRLTSSDILLAKQAGEAWRAGSKDHTVGGVTLGLASAARIVYLSSILVVVLEHRDALNLVGADQRPSGGQTTQAVPGGMATVMIEGVNYASDLLKEDGSVVAGCGTFDPVTQVPTFQRQAYASGSGSDPVAANCQSMGGLKAEATPWVPGSPGGPTGTLSNPANPTRPPVAAVAPNRNP